jgi:hypothetical protein
VVISVGRQADWKLSIDVRFDTVMCFDGERAASGITASRIAANIAG